MHLVTFQNPFADSGWQNILADAMAILVVGMGIILLRAYYYPAESQIESPPDIQHTGRRLKLFESNTTNRRIGTNTKNTGQARPSNGKADKILCHRRKGMSLSLSG